MGVRASARRHPQGARPCARRTRIRQAGHRTQLVRQHRRASVDQPASQPVVAGRPGWEKWWEGRHRRALDHDDEGDGRVDRDVVADADERGTGEPGQSVDGGEGAVAEAAAPAQTSGTEVENDQNGTSAPISIRRPRRPIRDGRRLQRRGGARREPIPVTSGPVTPAETRVDAAVGAVPNRRSGNQRRADSCPPVPGPVSAPPVEQHAGASVLPAGVLHSPLNSVQECPAGGQETRTDPPPRETRRDHLGAGRGRTRHADRGDE